ncbi:hypothetical protein HHI36_013118 [Cryptolaemus montrouzieri]|uniref:Uncharacterized protein n=1 Tax=Cryptolaemus montrouzieri TaxID=559131 RepID=A0ABD2NG62_9CUCU
MSESIPSTSACSSKQTSSNPNIRKDRKKYEKLKLPTPPPDPRENKKETCTEREFLEYLEQLQKHTANYSRSTSTLASALIAENAFDHLERLYKLMEQMLELRAQNAKLHRKIRDLEHLNNLEKMYREVENLTESDCPALDKDTAFAETILESILYEPKTSLKPKGSLRQSLMRKHRNRSSSAIDKPVSLDIMGTQDQRRASLCISNTKKSSKVSKWTKVKAAFKWEKASSTVGDAKSLDSGISGIAPVEIARYLRVPSNDDAGHSPSDSGAAEISTPGSLSSASSNENFHKTGHRSLYEEPRSSDDEHSHNYSSHSKEDSNISPRSSQRSHRTPWARMKDMINTRNPVRKKSRLSTHSDDIQIDIELCSDNEEVFEDNQKPQPISTSAATSSGKLDSENDIPLDVRERYKSSNEGLMNNDYSECRKISKWTKVKKAFLPAFDGAVETSVPKDDLLGDGRDVQAEINRNYRHLQKKLSIEFQDKLNEWKRIKQNTTNTLNPAPSSSNAEEPNTTNMAFMKKMEEWEKIKSQPTITKSNIQMKGEDSLPPEFKKKMQEWEKIKKSSVRKSTKKLSDIPRWKSIQVARTPEASHIEIPVISEEFKKKLEEWKHIKASGYKNDENERKNIDDKTPSPKLLRLDSKAMKVQQEKELQWYEKELNKIEKEKGRLERERQKFMEREERLSKLKKSVTGDHKRDILVHTPSGFYKFEGISRKFTQKLYEWEKSRGVRPEYSTFAFLTPEYPKSTIPKVKINGEEQTPSLARSRSVDSVVVSTMNTDCPLVSQPSSLSLNDVDELERTCRIDSKSSSAEYLPSQCPETDAEEPEALIVEVEDFIEETAAPLKSFVEQHNPVYQCEVVRALCEGETCLSPKIRRSESARAQTNYNLIEEVLVLLRHIAENDKEIQNPPMAEKLFSKKELHDQQQNLVCKLIDNLQKLQEENSLVVLNLTKENQDKNSNHIIEILEVVQDLSLEISTMAEKLKHDIEMDNERHTEEFIEEIKGKLLELRRHLSYVCAASDSTAPMKRKLCRMKSIICEKLSNESQCTSDISQTSGNSEQYASRSCGTYVKSETRNTQSQGAVKKRIRYRVENIRRKSLQDSDEDEQSVDEQKKWPKFVRSRTLSDNSVHITEQDEIADDRNANIFPVVSKLTYKDSLTRLNSNDSPVTIFVKTTRKLFTPFIERGFEESEVPENYVHDKVDISTCTQKLENDIKMNVSSDTSNDAQSSGVTGLPPLPSSPTPQRKYLKDMSPSIRMMLAKYHQKISEQDSSNRSGGSSGSASPVAWRSPTAERRVKAQTEKYQEEIKKSSPIALKREVQKSVSQGYIQNVGKREASSSEYKKNIEMMSISRDKCIHKSCSAANLTQKNIQKEEEKPVPETIRNILDYRQKIDRKSSARLSSALRLEKLKKAKEEFLNSGPSSAPPLDNSSKDILQYPTRNRLSQISVDSSSSTSSISPGLLVKSVSAGMINISEEAFKHIEGQTRREYVSLPRNSTLNIVKNSTLSNIAAKFRKVKMRRGKDKDKEKYTTVSELCRQSLVVDINEQSSICNSDTTLCRSIAYEAQPTISKSSSWIRRTKYFKK